MADEAPNSRVHENDMLLELVCEQCPPGRLAIGQVSFAGGLRGAAIRHNAHRPGHTATVRPRR